jgi:hypothetical protein
VHGPNKIIRAARGNGRRSFTSGYAAYETLDPAIPGVRASIRRHEPVSGHFRARFVGSPANVAAEAANELSGTETGAEQHPPVDAQ